MNPAISGSIPPTFDPINTEVATPPSSRPTTIAVAQGYSGMPGTMGGMMRDQLREEWANHQAVGHHVVEPAGSLDVAALGENCFFPIKDRLGSALYQGSQTDIPALQQQLASFTKALKAHETSFRGRGYIDAPNYQDTVILPTATTLKIAGRFINANYICLSSGAKKITGEAVAIACAFPLQAQLEQHFQMIHQERPSVLVVLTESHELEAGKIEYFKHDGQFGEMHVHVDLGPKVMQPNEGGLAMQCYTLSVGKNDQHVVSTPVIHVTNWKDGTAVKAEQMMPLANLMRLVQTKDEIDGRPRLPLVHCKAGVGRTAETIGAYLLAYDPDVRSAEGLIKDLKSSRGSWMAYVPGQQAELGRMAAMREMPVLTGPIMQANMRHIGYADIAVREDGNLLETLADIGCVVEHEQIMSFQEAQSHLDGLGAIEGAIVLNVKRGGQVLHQMLWSEAADNAGRDAKDGEPFHGTPLEFCKAMAAQPGASFNTVEIISVLPSWDAGEISLFTEEPAAKTQCELSGYLSKEYLEGLSDLMEISNFLEARGMGVFTYDIGLSNRGELATILESAKSMNIMLEYHDPEKEENVRYILKKPQQEGSEGIDVLQFLQEKKSFTSLQGLIENIWEQSGSNLNSIVSILSREPIAGLEQISNFDEDEEKSDQEPDMNTVIA